MTPAELQSIANLPSSSIDEELVGAVIQELAEINPTLRAHRVTRDGMDRVVVTFDVDLEGGHVSDTWSVGRLIPRILSGKTSELEDIERAQLKIGTPTTQATGSNRRTVKLSGETFFLKEDLKSQFDAIWSASDRCWKVSKANAVAAQKFIDDSAAIVAERRAKEAEEKAIQADLNRRISEALSKVNEVKSKLESFKRDRINADELQALIFSSSQIISSVQPLFEIAAEKLKADKEALEKKRQDIEARIAEVIDLPAARKAAQNMIWAARSGRMSKPEQAEWDEAQAMLHKQLGALHAAGFGVRAIALLDAANRNRLDRDNPKYITEKDWLTLYTIEHKPDNK
jgi:hypothetical protein